MSRVTNNDKNIHTLWKNYLFYINRKNKLLTATYTELGQYSTNNIEDSR